MEAKLKTHIFSKWVSTDFMKADELSRAFEFGGNPVPAFIKERLSPRQAFRLKRVFPKCERMIRRVNALGGTMASPLSGRRPDWQRAAAEGIRAPETSRLVSRYLLSPLPHERGCASHEGSTA